MPSKSAEDALLHMRDNILLAQQFIGGAAYESFRDNPMMFYAVTRMAKTKSFKELVQNQVKADGRFADALLREGIDAMLSGDFETGKTSLRDDIKATVGFEKLGEATGAPPKNLSACSGHGAIRRLETSSA